MKAYHNTAGLKFDDPTTGNAASGALVTVRINSSQSLSVIYDLDDVATGNPLTADSNGNYSFKAADDIYDIIISEGTANEEKLVKVEIAEIPTTPILINDLSQAYEFDDVEAILTSTDSFPNGKIGATKAYEAIGDGGVITYIYDTGKDKAMHNGVSIIDPTHTGPVSSAGFLLPENVGGGVWVGISGSYVRTFNVTVGASSQFVTLNEAINHLSNIKPTYMVNPNEIGSREDTNINVTLSAGFVMQEQLLLSNVDLGYIWITAADAVTTVIRSSMTREFVSRGLLESKPLFGISNGVFPTLNAVVFSIDSSGAANGRNGIVCRDNGSIYFNFGVGILNAWWGCYLSYRSRANVMDLDVSGFLEHGIHIRHNSHLTGRNLVKANGGTGRALNVESNSVIEITGGCQIINSISTPTANLRASGNSTITISGNTGLFTEAERTIDATTLSVIYCEQSSKISVFEHNLDHSVPVNCFAVVTCTTNGYVDISTSRIIAIAPQRALWAQEGGEIKAQGVAGVGCTQEGLLIEAGGIIDATAGDFSGSVIGASISDSELRGSNIDLSNCSSYGIFSTIAGEVNVSFADISGCGNDAIFARRGSVIKCPNANLSSTVMAINALESSHVYANNANTTRTTAGNSVTIAGGSIVSNVGGTGQASTAVNAVTQDGIIFR
ncbi:MAG: hypothetical protein COA84_14955 [Robiginitomaculum sp.]|nr:MAG: hypothetical protein COA84_14955 [Robiginitomaculum sp.]